MARPRKTRRPSPGPAPELFRHDGDALVITLPVKTKNTSNGPHMRPEVAAGQRKALRAKVAKYLALCPRWETLPVRVTITRHSAGRLDAHDGLGAALKPVIDSLALYLPLPRRMLKVRSRKTGELREVPHAEDSDPRVTWVLAQAKCRPGQSWLSVRIEPRGGVA